MGKRRALIFGVTGQDGSYMAEHLLAKNYDVYGVVRRVSVPTLGRLKDAGLIDKVTLLSGDVTDASSVNRIISELKPEEVYNFAAMSHVHVSFDEPGSCFHSTAVGCLNCLEAIKTASPRSHYFYAGSSEQFGDQCDPDGHQRITTPFNPRSPYAVAKVAAFQLTKVYRESYGLYACSAIAFNHESPRRGLNFVTRKITDYVGNLVASIDRGELPPKLKLGNINAKRDWSHAKDFVRGFHLMLNQEMPEDFVFSSMETHSVREFLTKAFEAASFLFEESGAMPWEQFTEIDPKYMRPLEVPYLLGDSTYTREKLGWKPEISFDDLVVEMVANDFKLAKAAQRNG
jgi:GDPmannose 4,6-dehydratase